MRTILSRLLTIAGVMFMAAASVRGEDSLPPVSDEPQIDWDQEREFWSFRAPIPPPRPQVRNQTWPQQPLDYFILARLEEKQLTPSPAADRTTLVRRLTFDVTGLPPTPEEVDAFVSDIRPDAYARFVERLLASPRFGERMASMWLPLARYAEDQAHQVGSDTSMFYPNAYRYREWVIDAFNHDLPYDQFVRFQLAADQFDNGADHLPALGFIGLGPKYYNRNRVEVQADEWEDRVDTVTRSMLGLTVACARCHDHKYEPITTSEYYSLAGVFASTKMINRTPEGKALEGKVKADEMPPGTLHVIEDGEPRDLNVFIRGSTDRKGPVAERRFLRILSSTEPEPFQEGSGRRELAQAIASPQNPLTARVFVNRVLGMFFGRPVVQTPSNFGHSGTLPTHPELLDDLAIRFVKNGWSIKALVREIVSSASYRQSSRSNPQYAAIDAANQLLWRMNRRRLTVEQWRDAVLFVSRQLEWEGGKSLELDDPANHRRTVYGRISRLKLNDLLMQFDYPDANVHAEQRAVTTTAVQKLFILNSEFMLQHASALAARLMADPNATDADRVRRAYRIVFGREPDLTETDLALEFLTKSAEPKKTRWEQYAQLLLACNEMMYLD